MSWTSKDFTQILKVEVIRFISKGDVSLAQPRPILHDGGKNAPYYFLCPNCEQNSCHINHLNSSSVEEVEFQEPSFPLGHLFKVLVCNNCQCEFYIGIGYREPNNGRNLFEICKIHKIKTGYNNV